VLEALPTTADGTIGGLLVSGVAALAMTLGGLSLMGFELIPVFAASGRFWASAPGRAAWRLSAALPRLPWRDANRAEAEARCWVIALADGDGVAATDWISRCRTRLLEQHVYRVEHRQHAIAGLAVVLCSWLDAEADNDWIQGPGLVAEQVSRAHRDLEKRSKSRDIARAALLVLVSGVSGAGGPGALEEKEQLFAWDPFLRRLHRAAVARLSMAHTSKPAPNPSLGS
jgi:hypothetical protein